MRDAADLTARAAAEAIAAAHVTSAELTDACLARAAAFEALGAFVVLDEEGARRQAAARDRELRSGRGRGALHGLPVAVKDLVDVAGLPTRAGSQATDATPAEHDAPVVERLRAAGAVVLGKTATHEFAYGVTNRSVQNPWDGERLAGGSSGGSAVAAAIGACPLALGSDTAGSCRIPAALCGVAGMTSRPGTLPMQGVVPLAPGLDALGFLARSADDLAFAWTTLTGQDVVPATAQRVGAAPEAALGPVDEAVLDASARAAERLAPGARPIEVALPALADFNPGRGALIRALALEAHVERGWWPERAEHYGEDVAAELRRGERLDADEVREARRGLDVLAAELRRSLEAVDVLVLPTTPAPAPPREGDDPLGKRERRHAAELTRLCGPVNVAGLAAVTVFGGLDGHGLPLGVQVVARDEVTALGAAVALERAAGPAPAPPLLAAATLAEGAGREEP